MNYITTLSVLAATTATAALAAPALAAPVTFGQTSQDANTGAGDFGQAFVLNDDGSSSFNAPSYTLDSATFYRGSGVTSGTTLTDLFLDVYENTGADESATFGTGGAPTGVSYLGSSTNSVPYSTLADGAALDFTFSGISLDADTKYYLVFSRDGAAGSLVGTSTQQFQGTGGFTYVNIDDVDTAPLLVGNEAGDTGNAGSGANEHRFLTTVTAVPEPGGVAAAFACLSLLAARRRRC